MKIPLAFALVSTLGGAMWAQAQVVPETPTLTKPESQTYSVPIRNVKASLMAYWLDPANHELPIELGPATPEQTHQARPNKGVFQLPTGVTRIVAVDPQNTLLVFGTPEGVQQLRSTITFLDRPLRQVEVEAQFVQMKSSELKAFGLGAKPEFNSPQLNRMAGFVRGNFSAHLADLVAAGKATSLSSPRVTAINNLTASISQNLTTPVEIGVRDATGTLRPLEDGNFLEGAPLLLSSDLKLDVTPTINNDDTITVLLETGTTRRLVTNGATTVSAANKFPALGEQKDSSLKTIFNVRDGETIALSGMNFHPQPLPEALSAQTKLTTVLFVTARIVRQPGG